MNCDKFRKVFAGDNNRVALSYMKNEHSLNALRYVNAAFFLILNFCVLSLVLTHIRSMSVNDLSILKLSFLFRRPPIPNASLVDCLIHKTYICFNNLADCLIHRTHIPCNNLVDCRVHKNHICSIHVLDLVCFTVGTSSTFGSPCCTRHDNENMVMILLTYVRSKWFAL